LTEPQKPKYQQIVTDLQKAITSGEYKEGQRLPSEADLTKRFSTSRLTVQRALKELQHQALIERRAGSGTYVRRNERSDRYVFGLLIPGLGETEIFEPICQGMARAGRAGGHALLWGDTTHASSDCESDHEQRTRELCEYYLDRRVTGIFFAPLELTQSMDCVNQWVVDTLTEARIPVVLLDRDIYRYPRRCGFDLVGIDNRRAGFLMTEHLLRHGCKRALFLGRPLSAYTVDSRIAGFQDALQAFQVANVHGQVHIGDPDDVDPLRSIFGAKLQLLPRNDPTLRLTHAAPELRRLGTYFWFYSGTEDRFRVQNRTFARRLTRLGIPNLFFESHGGHNWALWRKHAVAAYEIAAGRLRA